MADEPEILDDDETFTPATEEESSALAGKLVALKSRCDAAGIEFVQDTDEDGDSYARISIQAGRGKRTIFIFTEPRADSLLSVEFEKYRFISGYESIISYKDNYIESGLLTTRLSPVSLLQRLQGKPISLNSAELESLSLRPPDSLNGRPALEIGPSSPEFNALGVGRASRITFKLKGVRATQHDQALAELRSYADSVFFQIDMMFDSTFILERERRARLSPLNRRHQGRSIEYPSAHYNEEAMSLYWYAKSARNMPLLRFLAFYQSIEFYFLRYSQTEARRRIGGIIKHPTFRAHRDDDLDRLISAIHPARSGGLGSERAQLRAVVSECISADEMRQYLMDSRDREEYFSGRGSKPKYHKVPISNKTADLRNDVADRIYDIRCKIVHTKNEHSDDDFPMILPFSDDADFLMPDIDLVEFVAKSVLVSSSGELT